MTSNTSDTGAKAGDGTRGVAAGQGPEALAEQQLDRVSGGLSLLGDGLLATIAPTDPVAELGKLVGGKNLLAQVRPDGGGITPFDHQSRDMD